MWWRWPYQSKVFWFFFLLSRMTDLLLHNILLYSDSVWLQWLRLSLWNLNKNQVAGWQAFGRHSHIMKENLYTALLKKESVWLWPIHIIYNCSWCWILLQFCRTSSSYILTASFLQCYKVRSHSIDWRHKTWAQRTEITHKNHGECFNTYILRYQWGHYDPPPPLGVFLWFR